MNKLAEMQSQDFTMNLVSNASIATFPNKTLAHMTTSLSQQLIRSVGSSSVGSFVAFSNSKHYQRKFKYQLKPAQPDDGHREDQREKIHKRAYGLVTMHTPPKIEDHYLEQKTGTIKPGFCLTVDKILTNIFKKSF